MNTLPKRPPSVTLADIGVEEDRLRFDPSFDLHYGPLKGQKFVNSSLGGGIEIRKVGGHEPTESHIDVTLNFGGHLGAKTIPGFRSKMIPVGHGLAVIVAVARPGLIVERFDSNFGTHKGIYQGGPDLS